MKKIILHTYDELSPGMGFPSMKDYFEKSRYEGQTKIVEYLRQGHVHGACASIPLDVYTGEVIPEEKTFKNDEKYSWVSTLAYYVERYNLRLPRDFETWVLDRAA